MNGNQMNNTQYFKTVPDTKLEVKQVLEDVYKALMEKGYNQIGRASCRERV